MSVTQVTFPNAARVPAIGQGTWMMGERDSHRRDEVAALQQGLDLGLTLIDTAEMYGNGGAERIVGKAIRGRRDDVFLVSKVLPGNARRQALIEACERSLKHLGTEHIELYLLHWWSSTPLDDILETFDRLIEQGKIGAWGVSNFDSEEMARLDATGLGERCQTNQVLYNLGSRGIDFELLPRLAQRGMPVMAYCPLAQAGALDDGLWQNPALLAVADKHRVSVGQVLLAWSIRPQWDTRPVLAIPKATRLEHVRDNARALQLTLDAEDLAALERAFPTPTRKLPLDIV